jgi:hypothetical protein
LRRVRYGELGTVDVESGSTTHAMASPSPKHRGPIGGAGRLFGARRIRAPEVESGNFRHIVAT